MSLLEHDIIHTDHTIKDAAIELIRQMVSEDTSIITMIKGEDATDEDCEQIRQFIEDHYEVDIDVQDGGQPVYSFIIGAE